MPVVGEAVVLVRVLSNKLAGDIRKAVKDALNDTNSDIDAEGRKAGERLNTSMANAVKKDMERVVGKEVVLATRRLAITSGGAVDDTGGRLGRRFVASVGNGIRDNDSIIGRQLSSSLIRAVNSDNSNLNRSSRLLGSNLIQMIGRGLEDNSAESLGTPFRRVVQKELVSGANGALVRASDVDSKLFMRNFVQGLRDGEGLVNDQLRRTFENTVRDQERDLTNGFRRVFVSGIQGATPDIRSAFHSTLRNVVIDAVGDVDNDTSIRRRWFSAARGWAENIGNGFNSRTGALRRTASGLSDRVVDGFNEKLSDFRDVGERMADRVGDGMRRRFPRTSAFARQWADSIGESWRTRFGRAGEDAADEADRGIRRRSKVNLGGLLKVFSDLGENVGKHFNLGIGAARMGAAIISILATAGPGIIAAGSAIITSLVAEIVTLMAAIGPGIAGAIGVGLAAVSSLGLTFGLLFAAFKSGVDGLDDLSKSFKELGKELGTPIAEGMLPGMVAAVATLRAALPQLNGALAETGKAFGRISVRIADTVTSVENMSRIQGILATNTTFIDRFGEGIAGLTTSFLVLFNAAKPFIDFVGEGIQRFGEWAAASLAVSEANGNLAAWMNSMLAAFKDLWAITKNFASGFGAIFSAAAPAGQTMLDSIRGIAERFHAWTSDTGNMERMTAFFDKAHTLASKVWEVLGAIFTAGGHAFEAMDLGPLLHVLDTLQNTVMPAIARFFNQIQAGASDNLVKAFDNLGSALTKIADSGSFEKVAELISTVILKITEFANTDLGANLLAILLPVALMGGILTSLVAPVFALGKAVYLLYGAFAALSAPVLLIIAIAAGVAAAFALMYANSENFRTAVSNLLSVVGGAFMAVWDKLSPKLAAIVGKIQELASAIGDRLAPVLDFIAPILARVVEFIGDMLGNIIDAISGFIDILIGVFTGDWTRIWEGVKQVLSAAWQSILTVLGGVLSYISIIWDAIVAVIYAAGQVIWGIMTSIWSGIADVAYTVWNAIFAFFETIFNAITGAIVSFGNAIPPFLAGIWQWIQDAAIAAWNAIYAFFETIFTTITGAITSFGNAIPPFLASVWQTIQDVATSVWNAIYAFFETIFNTITNGIRSFGNAIPPFLEGIWNSVKSTASSIWNSIVGIATTIWTSIKNAVISAVDTLVGALQTIWNNIKSAVSSAWNGLASTVSAVWGGIRDAIVAPVEAAWSLVSGWVSKIAGIVTGILGTVASAVTTVNGQLASIQAQQIAATSVSENMLTLAGPGQTPSILGPGGIGGGIARMLMQQLSIPGLATGGIVPAIPGGSMFRLGEGGQRERVEPLSADGLSNRDRAMIKTIVSSTIATMSGGGVNVDVRIGEHGLDQFVTQSIRRENSDLARRVGKVKR